MPNYRNHIILGLIILGTLGYFIKFKSLLEFFMLLVIIIIYSLLPDVDSNSSKIGIFTKISLLFFALIFMLFGYYFIASLFCILVIILFFVKHRGFFHTFRAAILFSLPILYLGKIYFGFAIVSYIGHMLIDKHVKW